MHAINVSTIGHQRPMRSTIAGTSGIEPFDQTIEQAPKHPVCYGTS